MIRKDKADYLEKKASEAESAARRGDSRTSFAIVRSLSGRFGQTTKPPVRRRDGTKTHTEEERKEEWTKHFAGVYCGEVVARTALQKQTAMDVDLPKLGISAVEVEMALGRLGTNKGVGYDLLPAEVLRAGGTGLYAAIALLYGKVVDELAWPVQWSGGRIADVYKRKGDKDDMDAYRGILLNCHMSKGLAVHLDGYVNAHYSENMPLNQFGATAKRGTDAATMLVRSFVRRCHDWRRSFYVLFVDLVKAYDQIVRELVVGIPKDCGDPRAHLQSLGLSEVQVVYVAAFCAEHGSVFEKWGVHPRVVLLLQRLHQGAWFAYESLDQAVTTSRGGRQGCTFGSKLFNSAHSLGMVMLAASLEERGVSTRFVACVDVFGGGLHQGSRWEASPCQVAFVDDRVIMASARSPSQLDQAITHINRELFAMASKLKFEINLKPGKTEALLRYRGKGATRRMRAWLRGDGSLAVPVPEAGGDRAIRIVQSYKHLGGIIRDDGSPLPECRARSQSGMAAYSPIAQKVFGASQISQSLRCQFLRSLVCSRTFSTPTHSL